MITLFNILFIGPPLLILIFSSCIKLLNSEFEFRGFGFDSYIIGMMYLFPVPLLLPNLFSSYIQEIIFLFMFVAFLFAINVECFVKSKGKPTIKKARLEKICMTTGLFVFSIGLIFALFV